MPGIFLTLEDPTHDMITEAASAGLYHSPGWNQDYPKIQILTIHELLNGAEIKTPMGPVGKPQTQATFKQAAKARADDGSSQPGLGLE